MTATKNPLELETATETTEPTTVIAAFDGVDYVVPANSRLWPLEALEASVANDLIGLVREMLGSEQYAAFRAGRDGARRTVGDLLDFQEVILKAQVETGK